MKRYDEIDIARGIAILLVVIGHCITDHDNPLNRFILSFHMPLFFILSGLVAKPREDRKALPFIKKKMFRILPAQITLGCIELIYVNLIGVVSGTGIDLSPTAIFNAIFRWWFLLVLFESEVLFFYLSNIMSNNRKIISVLALDMIAAMILLKNKLPLYINVVPFSLFFYILGFWMRNLYLKHEPGKHDWQIIVYGGITVGILANLNQPILMYDNQYGNMFLFLLTAILGSVVVLLLAKHMVSKWLVYVGTNSLIIYVLQFHSILVLRKIMHVIVFDKIRLDNTAIYYLAVIGMEMVALMILTPFMKRYFPWAFGMKKRV